MPPPKVKVAIHDHGTLLFAYNLSYGGKSRKLWVDISEEANDDGLMPAAMLDERVLSPPWPTANWCK